MLELKLEIVINSDDEVFAYFRTAMYDPLEMYERKAAKPRSTAF